MHSTHRSLNTRRVLTCVVVVVDGLKEFIGQSTVWNMFRGLAREIILSNSKSVLPGSHRMIKYLSLEAPRKRTSRHEIEIVLPTKLDSQGRSYPSSSVNFSSLLYSQKYIHINS